MQQFFNLLTAHGLVVTVDRTNGALASSSITVPSHHVRVVACVARSAPGLCLLTTETDEPLPFFVYPLPLEKTGVILMRTAGEPRIALMHPFYGVHVTASPIADTPLSCAAQQIREWELYERAPVSPEAFPNGARSRLERIEQFVGESMTLDRIRHILTQDPEPADALTSLLPVLRTSVLDAFASDCLHNVATSDRIASIFPSDRWAQDALPALIKWTARSVDDGNSERAEASGSDSAVEPKPKRVLGKDLDFLGEVGQDGRFTSFAQACVVRARRQVEPRKKIAILATARNEGIYLLEWIAYYRGIGVEAFFLYSNDNDDGSDALLAALAAAGVITWIDNRVTPGRGRAQFKAYGHALSFMPDLLDYEWTLVVDLDEFFVLDRRMFHSITDFCDWHRDRGADNVAVNWAFIGSQEVSPLTALPLIHRNLRLLSGERAGDGGRLVKSLVRTRSVCHSEAHVPFCDERSGLYRVNSAGVELAWHKGAHGFPHSPKFADTVLEHPAIIYHYIYKSAEEWLWKQARNGGDHILVTNEQAQVMDPAKAMVFMGQHNLGDSPLTLRALDCAPGLSSAIGDLAKLPGVTEAYADMVNRYKEKLDMLRSPYRDLPGLSDWNPEALAFLKLAKALP